MQRSLLGLETDLREFPINVVHLGRWSDHNGDGGRWVEEWQEVRSERVNHIFFCHRSVFLQQLDVVILRDAFEGLVEERDGCLVDESNVSMRRETSDHYSPHGQASKHPE